MLRITVSKSAAAAKQYYTEGLTRAAEYYLHGQGVTGRWGGEVAARLGLTGDVTKEDFFALVENQHPTTGETLTARQKKDRRPGVDLTFNAPKGFSVMQEWLQSHRPALAKQLDAAFRTAVEETLRSDVEPLIQTRVRKGGAVGDRTTSTMAYAIFDDTLTRPLADGIEDPHRHAHVYIPNITWDAEESRYKAIEYYDLHINRPYLEAAFHSRLAALTQSLGFSIERHGKWWDIALPDSLIDKFSRRTKAIEKKARELGIMTEEGQVLDPVAMATLGATTRGGKSTSLHLDTEARRDAWWRKLTAEEEQALRRAASGEHPHGAAQREKNAAERWAAWEERVSPYERTDPDAVLFAHASGKSAGLPGSITPEETVRYAIADCFERASVVPETLLLETALRRGYGAVRPEAVKNALSQAGLLTRTVGGQTLATTREALAEERSVIAFARDGRGTCRALNAAGKWFHSDRLNQDQIKAVRHVLTSTDRVMIVRGVAGSGKTTLTKDAARLIEATGQRVAFFAPSANAARGVLRREGFADADTIARLLVDEVMQQRIRGHVLWIDEAGLVSMRDMQRIFTLAEALDCRVVLSGDTKQHASISRGDALRILEERSGVRTVEVKEIVRQKGAYKTAVSLLEKGDTEGGFRQLENLGWVVEIPDELRHSRLVKDYLAVLDAGESALVVSPSHREGDAVTRQIRDALKERGGIGKQDRTCWTLTNLYWTDAQKSDASRYRPGLVVQFTQNAPGITNGERFRIEEVSTGGVRLISPDGREARLPLGHTERFQVYEPVRLGVAVGDTIRVTQNYRSARDGYRLDNGTLGQVKAFTDKGELVLANGRTLGSDFAHFTHGYVTTSYASQGSTVDRVLIAQGSESFPASSREQFYVSASRGRKEARIYTDDKEALRQRIRESGNRTSATELMGEESTVRQTPVSLAELRRGVAERYRRLTAKLERIQQQRATPEHAPERNWEDERALMER